MARGVASQDYFRLNQPGVAMNDARLALMVLIALALATAGAYWLSGTTCSDVKTITIGTVMKMAGC